MFTHLCPCVFLDCSWYRDLHRVHFFLHLIFWKHIAWFSYPTIDMTGDTAKY